MTYLLNNFIEYYSIKCSFIGLVFQFTNDKTSQSISYFNNLTKPNKYIHFNKIGIHEVKEVDFFTFYHYHG